MRLTLLTPKKTLTLEFLRFRSASSKFCNIKRPEKLLALYWVLSAYLQAWTHMRFRYTHTHTILDRCIPHLWPQNISMKYKIWITSPIFLRHSPLRAGPTSSGEWGLVGGGRLQGRQGPRQGLDKVQGPRQGVQGRGIADQEGAFEKQRHHQQRPTKPWKGRRSNPQWRRLVRRKTGRQGSAKIVKLRNFCGL